MIYRFAAVALLSCVLAGCTDADWDHAMSYAGLGDKPATEAQAAPSADAAPAAVADASAPKMDDWCAVASKAAAREAADMGFDATTQRTRGDQALRQCQAGR
jgi:hypothetical protein